MINMVTAPASTGIASRSRNAVTRIDQQNSGILNIVMPGARMFKIVAMKLIAPSSDEIPARCSENSEKSVAMPGEYCALSSGGYSVHPAPVPSPMVRPSMMNTNPAARNQKLILFSRGNAISGAPIIIGTNQFPMPPISAGITIQKIISKPCAVMIEFHSEPLVTRWLCGYISCARMIIERIPPTLPPITAMVM